MFWVWFFFPSCSVQIHESSPLDLASEEPERLPCLQRLLQLGADVNAADKNGMCAPSAPPARVLPAVSPCGWDSAGHGVWVLPSRCCKCSLAVNLPGLEVGCRLQNLPGALCFLLVCWLCQVPKGAETSSVQSMGEGMRPCLHRPVVPPCSKPHSAMARMPSGATANPAHVAYDPVPTAVHHQGDSRSLPEGEGLFLPMFGYLVGGVGRFPSCLLGYHPIFI